MKKILLFIPARLQASRFPGKLLAPIKNQSLIHRVWQNCRGVSAAGLSFEVAVVTDSEEIEGHVASFGGRVFRVDDAVSSGSERVFLGWKRFVAEQVELVLNIQGDEPLLLGSDLQNLAQFHLDSDFDIATLVTRREDAEWQNPHNVKVAWNSASGRCLYFSRSPVPFEAGENPVRQWWHHAGVYSYRPRALEIFCEAPRGECEQREQLEQLRALELGLSIGALSLDKKLVGVDVPADVAKVEALL